MKRLICAVIAICLLTVGCAQSVATERHPFFGDEGEERFIIVDQTDGEFGGYRTRVYADTVTGVMYLYVRGNSSLSITPLLCEDGSPMIYDAF